MYEQHGWTSHKNGKDVSAGLSTTLNTVNDPEEKGKAIYVIELLNNKIIS
jgi:hypothetical protein